MTLLVTHWLRLSHHLEEVILTQLTGKYRLRLGAEVIMSLPQGTVLPCYSGEAMDARVQYFMRDFLA